MYQWNTTTLPAASFDGQIFVDDKRLVWKWNAAIGAWLRAEQMYLREVARLWVEATNRPIGTSITRMYGGRLHHQWDPFFALTFCELHTSQSDQHSYQAHLTQAELDAWVLGIVTNDGANYNENAEVIAYEVVDPTIRCGRIQVWNSVYGSARGAMAYNRKWGRERQGLPLTMRSDSRWRGGSAYWTDAFVEPGRNFMQEFHGIATPSNPDVSDQLIWFRSGHRNLYHHPRVGSQVRAEGRTVYDSNTNTYVACNTYLTVGQPRVFYRRADASDRELDNPNALSGSKFLKHSMNGIMVYPLQDGTQYAFLIKPIGVDYVAFSFESDAQHQIVSLASYGDSAEMQRRIPVGTWNGTTELSYRFLLHNAVPLADSLLRSGLDSAQLLQGLSFYARDATTGVASETFDTRIKVVRRKANISTSFEPRRVSR